MVNMGNMGNIGNIASLASAIISPDRDEFPFIAERLPSPSLADPRLRSEPAPDPKAGVRGLRLVPTKWPEEYWSAEWRAWQWLTTFAKEFFQTKKKPGVNGNEEEFLVCRIELADWHNDDVIRAELATLADYAEDERGDAMSEIVAQDGLYANFLQEFATMLGLSLGSHQNTLTLLHMGGVIGIYVAMHLKRTPGKGVEPRPRPSHYMPALKPPIAVQGHPSYPSGHALQAMLMALCVRKAFDGKGGNIGELLDVLARRIARNREIAGLHFPSDTTAGFLAATKVMDIIGNLEGFTGLVELAKKEWTHIA
jgi:hypothetical protein